MKKIWLVFISVGIGVICIFLFLGVGSGKKEIDHHNTLLVAEDIPFDQTELLPGKNTGNTAVKNACGVFGEILFEKICNEESDEIYNLTNHDVLSSYGYICNAAVISSYWINIKNASPDDARIMLFDIMPSKLTQGGVAVTYCITGPLSGSVDREAFNHNGSLWLSMMVYFDDQGEIVSMLPCVEASIDSYSALMGFEKKQY